MKKKLAIAVFSILFVIGLAGTLWGGQIAEAASNLWNSCPRGQVNCAYPGQCRSYIDTNGDRICDRGQSDPTAASEGTTAIAAVTTMVVSGPVSVNLAVSTPTTNSAGTDQTAADTAAAQAITLKRSYYFVPIFLALAALYALTWTLAAKKIIRTLTHRKIWNFVLLFSMIVSALLGLFLILNIDFNFNITLPFNLLFWHVEAGIALGAIGAFHILWHWRYFAKLLKACEKTAGSPA